MDASQREPPTCSRAKGAFSISIVLPCKWVFRVKETSKLASPKYNARLVATGFRQEYGVDFDEFFSLVVKMTTLRFLLEVVAVEDLRFLQLDIKNDIPSW